MESLQNKIDFRPCDRGPPRQPQRRPPQRQPPPGDIRRLRRDLRRLPQAEDPQPADGSGRQRVRPVGRPRNDDFRSLKDRADACPALTGALKSKTGRHTPGRLRDLMDVRSFGQVFAFKGKDDGVSVGIRGPVSNHPAFSVDPSALTACRSPRASTASPATRNPAIPWAPGTGWALPSTPPSAASTASWPKRPASPPGTPTS